MKNKFQTCSIKGHENNEVTCICTYKQCQQAQRLICKECLQKQIHYHESQLYVTKLDDFLSYLNNLKSKIEQYKQDAQKLSEFIQGCKQVIYQLQTIVEQSEHHLQNLMNIDTIYKLQQIPIEKLNNQLLNSLINFDKGNWNSMHIQNNVQKIIMQLQDLNKKFIKFSDVQQSDINKDQIQSPTISQNEKYCSFSNGFELRINNIKYNKIIINKSLIGEYSVVKFSHNSKFLFVGDIFGYFTQFTFKNNFKRIFFKQINRHEVRDILQINNNQVILIQQEIIIIDLIKRRQLLNIYNSSFVLCFEFDKINNLIICACDDQKINFFDRNTGQLVIQKSPSNPQKIQKIFQVQLINKSQNLVGCDQVSLRFFEIDLKENQLNLIKVFYYDVQYFRYVQEEQRIIIRNINQLIITDISFNIVYELQIEGQKFDKRYKFEQLESMNYIVIKDKIGWIKILRNMNN